MRRYFMFFLGTVVLFLGILLGLRQKTKIHTVSYLDSGFSPSQIEIYLGQQVMFVNNSSRDFWPASDLHPSHTVYSEFDPKRPISPGQSWSFKFAKAGVWSFHDHLFSSYSGLITVKSGFSWPMLTRALPKSCTGPASDKIQCWEKTMVSTLDKKGIDAAFDLVSNLYSTDPDFVPVCHDFVHKLGKAAYVQFSEKSKVVLSSRASFCGYGFYHGFMETLLTTTGTVKQAKEFCEQAQKELANQTSDAGGACYHGIGHGAADPHQEDHFSSIQELIDPGLRICEQVGETPDKLWRCSTGVYNVAEIAGTNGSYGFNLDAKDPFATCHVQPSQYQSACYPNFTPVALRLAGGNFSQAWGYLQSIANFEYKVSALTSIAVEEANAHGPVAENVLPSLATCRSLDSKFRLPCVAGLAEGFLKYGTPQKEYEQALKFCQMADLTSSEQDACYTRILPLLRIWYSQEKTQQICQSVPVSYRHFCP